MKTICKTREELKKKIIESNREYERIKSLLISYGFTLSTKHVFYGESPFNIYCGKMEDYQTFINNLDDIKERYLKNKMESLGIY